MVGGYVPPIGTTDDDLRTWQAGSQAGRAPMAEVGLTSLLYSDSIRTYAPLLFEFMKIKFLFLRYGGQTHDRPRPQTPRRCVARRTLDDRRRHSRRPQTWRRLPKVLATAAGSLIPQLKGSKDFSKSVSLGHVSALGQNNYNYITPLGVSA